MKHVISLILCLCFLSFICVPVSAHKGKTDWKGGHTDRSTGDYHYHHGYPAHDHYDVDGDGNVDCPYAFDDQTRSNEDSQSNNDSKPAYYPPIKLPTNPSEKPTESDTAIVHQARKLSFSDISVIILMIFLIVITVPVVVFFLCIMIPPLNFLVNKIGNLFSKSDESSMIVIRYISIIIEIYLIYKIITGS